MALSSIRTPATEDRTHPVSGYCADLAGNPGEPTVHFCAKDFLLETGETEIRHVVYIDIRNLKKHVYLDDGTVVLVHKQSRYKLPYAIDNTAATRIPLKNGETVYLTIHYLILPKITSRLIRDGQKIEAYVLIDGKEYWFKPTDIEMTEVRMVFNIETM